MFSSAGGKLVLCKRLQEKKWFIKQEVFAFLVDLRPVMLIEFIKLTLIFGLHNRGVCFKSTLVQIFTFSENAYLCHIL